MLRADIPGFGALELTHLVLDLNGTLTVDGALVPGVAERLEALRRHLAVHLVSADTRGNAARLAAGLGVALEPLPATGQAEAKAELIRTLGPAGCVAVGNGRIDVPMLTLARLGIAVVLAEGAAGAALLAADVVCTDIRDALDLLLLPGRLVATLRS
jgi:P-type E1-E2 ATPase